MNDKSNQRVTTIALPDFEDIEAQARIKKGAKTIRRKLGGLRSAIRSMFIAHGLARIVILVVLMLGWHMLTDALLEMPLWMRALALILMVALTGFAFLRWVLYPLSRNLTDHQLALLVEREYPMLKDRLISALQLLASPVRYKDVASWKMVTQTIDQGLGAAVKLDFKDAVRSRRLVGETVISAGLVAVLALVILTLPDFSNTWARRLALSSDEYPRDTHLNVLFPNNDELAKYPTNDVIDLNFTYDQATRTLRVARGTGVRIVAEPMGEIPREATMILKDSRGDEFESAMKPEFVEDEDGERRIAYFHYNIPSVVYAETVEGEARNEIYVEAGDAREGPYYLDAVPAPALREDSRLEFEYPAYMRLARKIQERRRAIEDLPQGTQVNFEFHTSVPLEKDGAKLRFYVSGADPAEVIVPALNEERTHFRLEHYAISPQVVRYEYELLGADGLRNTENYTYDVKVVKDHPPEVKIEFYGKGLSDESIVPVTLQGRLPLRYKVQDKYGVESVHLNYRIVSAGLDDAWREFTPYRTIVDIRKQSMRDISGGLDEIIKKSSELAKAFANKESVDVTKEAERFVGLRAQVGDAIDTWMDLESHGLRSLSDQSVIAQEDFVRSFKQLESDFLSIISAQNLKEDAGVVSEAMADGAKQARKVRELANELIIVTSTDVHEEYILSIADLLTDAQSPFRDEASLVQAMGERDKKPFPIELKLVAKDRNRDTDTGQGARGESLPALLELMPKNDLVNRISRYIRNTLKKDLLRIIKIQEGLRSEMQAFLDEKRRLNFDDNEGRESRRTLSSAQLTQGGLPDETRRLAEHFSNVAQAYIFNSLEDAESNKDQETRIQTIRILLHLLVADIAQGDAISNSLQVARSSESDRAKRIEAIEKILGELRLNEGLAGVGLDYNRGRLADLLEENELRVTSSLARLDALYKNIMRNNASSERRRKDLTKVLEYQEQTLEGLKIVRSRLKKWEGFDEIRQKLEDLYKALGTNLEGLKDLLK